MQTLCAMDRTDLYRKLVELGVNKGYASQISNGQRQPSLKLALRLFRDGGLRIGPLADVPPLAAESIAKANEARA